MEAFSLAPSLEADGSLILPGPNGTVYEAIVYRDVPYDEAALKRFDEDVSQLVSVASALDLELTL